MPIHCERCEALCCESTCARATRRRRPRVQQATPDDDRDRPRESAGQPCQPGGWTASPRRILSIRRLVSNAILNHLGSTSTALLGCLPEGPAARSRWLQTSSTCADVAEAPPSDPPVGHHRSTNRSGSSAAACRHSTPHLAQCRTGQRARFLDTGPAATSAAGGRQVNALTLTVG